MLIIFIFIILLLCIIFAVIQLRKKETFEKSNKKIFILYTGGTIGMKKTSSGYSPSPGLLEEKLKTMTDESMGKYTIQEFDKLLDSSNILPSDWVKIGNIIHKEYNNYDSFIVIHGTDTLSYTASALSFMFENLTKTVIVTGSMISLEETRNDGRNNLITSLQVASGKTIPEVIVVFDSKIMRGNRSNKTSSNVVNAFTSPNFPLLGIAGVTIKLNNNLIVKPRSYVTSYKKINDKLNIIILKLFPGINADYIRSVTKDVDGVVFELYGIGDGPSNPEFLHALEELGHKSIMVGGSQCLHHNVDEKDYATGNDLYKRGVIGGSDMTSEAAFAKLYFLLSQNYTKNEINNMIGTSLRGELSS